MTVSDAILEAVQSSRPSGGAERRWGGMSEPKPLAWQDVPGSYDLFLAAQAFHWISPAYGLARAAELLKTGGTIALVWTLDQSQGSAFWQATEPIYNTYNP